MYGRLRAREDWKQWQTGSDILACLLQLDNDEVMSFQLDSLSKKIKITDSAKNEAKKEIRKHGSEFLEFTCKDFPLIFVHFALSRKKMHLEGFR